MSKTKELIAQLIEKNILAPELAKYVQVKDQEPEKTEKTPEKKARGKKGDTVLRVLGKHLFK